MRNIPQEGEVYRHFKGNEYQIIALAEHSVINGADLVPYVPKLVNQPHSC